MIPKYYLSFKLLSIYIAAFWLAGYLQPGLYSQQSALANIYISDDTYLFPESTGGLSAVRYEKGIAFRDVISHAQKLHQGEKIDSIHAIQNRRIHTTLCSGKKGWVDIYTVAPIPFGFVSLASTISIKEIKKNPLRTSPSINVIASDLNKKFAKNTPVVVLEWSYNKGKYKQEKNIDFYTLWAKISLQEFTGWVNFRLLRFTSPVVPEKNLKQTNTSEIKAKKMPDTAIFFIWFPIQWFTTLLGDGFWAGLLILLLYYIPVFLGFFIARLLSYYFRFFPNFILYLIIIFIAWSIYSCTYSSIFYASSYNWSGGNREFGHILFVFLTLGIMVVTFQIVRQSILETRCPSCRFWQGSAYERELLGTTTLTTTTTETYSDGTKRKYVDKNMEEDWKDYCNCRNCGYRWTLYRTEKK